MLQLFLNDASVLHFSVFFFFFTVSDTGPCNYWELTYTQLLLIKAKSIRVDINIFALTSQRLTDFLTHIGMLCIQDLM